MDSLRRRRQQKEWTQAHLAEVSGVARRTIQRIESGKAVGGTETYRALAAALDCDALELQTQAGQIAVVKQILLLMARGHPAETELQRLSDELAASFRGFVTARDEMLRVIQRAATTSAELEKALNDETQVPSLDCVKRALLEMQANNIVLQVYHEQAWALHRALRPFDIDFLGEGI